MLTITITDPPFSFTADTTETVLSFTVSDQVGPAGPSYTLPTASTTVLGGVKVDGTTITITNGVISSTGGGAPEVKSSNFTAANDGDYTVTATLTVTDPTPAEGKGFSVFVRNGTATIGGTAYATAGTIIERIYHSGAWSNYAYQVASPYTLPIATGSVLGGIKSSTDILVDGTTGVATVATGSSDGSIPRFSEGGLAYSGIGALQLNQIISGNEVGVTFPATPGTIALTSDITLSDLGGLGTGVGTALAQATNSTSGLVTQSGADTRYAPISQLVESTAQIDATGTTQADVTGMTGVVLLANTWYRLEFGGRVTTTSGASWQIEMATTQTLSITSGTLPSIGNAGNTAVAQAAFTTSTRLVLLTRSTTGAAIPNSQIVLFKTGANAPTVKITFAQWTSPAGTASLLSGAVAVFTKVP
jgi:hypothetical protein